MWGLINPESFDKIKLEYLSALVMAHFSAVPEHECEQYRDELFEVLKGFPCEKESS